MNAKIELYEHNFAWSWNRSRSRPFGPAPAPTKKSHSGLRLRNTGALTSIQSLQQWCKGYSVCSAIFGCFSFVFLQFFYGFFLFFILMFNTLTI